MKTTSVSSTRVFATMFRQRDRVVPLHGLHLSFCLFLWLLSSISLVAAVTMSVPTVAKLNNTSSTSDYFLYPYLHHDDWLMLMDQGNGTTSNQQASTKPLQVYDTVQRKWINYHWAGPYWGSLKSNSYSFRIDENQYPVVKSILKIYWTFDQSGVPDDIRIIVPREQAGQSLSKYPLFIDSTYLLKREQRLRIITSMLQDALDEWSDTLDQRIIFEYIRYTTQLKYSPYFNSVLIVTMDDIDHSDAHTNITDSFISTSILAHATFNFIHFNRQTTKFYVAPHLMSKRVPIIIDNNDGRSGIDLYEISTEQLAQRYNFTSYEQLYISRRETIYKLAQSIGTTHNREAVHWCMACTMLHEIGHVLGLGHSDSKDSMMYPFNDDREALLSETDKMAIRQLYAPFLKRVRKKDSVAARKKCQCRCKGAAKKR